MLMIYRKMKVVALAGIHKYNTPLLLHVSLSLLCPAIDVLSGACMCLCAQIISTFSAFPWADSVSGAVLVFGSSESLCGRFSSLSCFRSSRGSLEGLETQTAEAGEERSSVLSEVIDHGNILAYLSGSSSSPRQRRWTPDRSVLRC